MRRLSLPAALAIVLAAAPFAGAAPAAPARAARAAVVPALPVPRSIQEAGAEIDGDRLHGDVAFLADDMLEGRGTGTRGYELAARYVANRFATLGLEPGGDSGYLQQVPFRRGTLVESRSSLALTRAGNDKPLTLGVDAMLSPDMLRETWTTEAPLVFAGYGVSAPEMKYDDFDGIDVRGKVLVEFRGAPPTFPHNERAYYSNSLVKEQVAVAHGAIGIISMLKPADAARQPWARSVRQGRMSACRWTDQGGAPANTQALIELSASLSTSGAEAVFEGAPETFSQAAEDAEAGKAHSFALACGVKARRVTQHAAVVSPNVVGILRGSDPRLAQEAIVVSAHLDHLGISEPVNGDTINNGAYDNASGSAMMMEVARAFTRARVKPRRSVIFLAVTGEEKGLQGSDYFARHPAPKGLDVVGDVNVDEILMLRPITSVIAFGAEHTSLGPLLERAAGMVGLHLIPDPTPEEVVFVRSDQFSFVKQGVPGIFPVSAMDGTAEALAADRKWNLEAYHSPSDDMSQVFDWPSGARFARMAFYTTWLAADGARAPAWNPGDFFGTRFRAKK